LVSSPSQEKTCRDANEVSKQEHGKCGGTNKDKVADRFMKVSYSCGSKRNDAQNSELAGGLEILVDQLPKDCVEEDIAMVFFSMRGC